MTSNADQPICTAHRRDGAPCKTPALPGDVACFAHSAALADRRNLARRAGGRNRAARVRLRRMMPERLTGVYEALETAISEVHAGTLSPRQGMAMAALGRACAAVLQVGELEARLRSLEEGARDAEGDRAHRGA